MELHTAYLELIKALKDDERIDLNPNLFPDSEIIKLQIANFTPHQFFTYLTQFSEHDVYSTHYGYINRIGHLSWYFSQLNRDCSTFNYQAIIMIQLIHGINHLMIDDMRIKPIFDYIDPFLDLLNLQTMIEVEDHDFMEHSKEIYGYAFDQSVDFDRFRNHHFVVSFRDLYISFGVPIKDFGDICIERLEPKVFHPDMFDVGYRTNDNTIKKMKKLLTELKANPSCPKKLSRYFGRITFLNN
jgi:hypothetical protein